MSRVNGDKQFLRDNCGPGMHLFKDLNSDHCYCEEFQEKAYLYEQNKVTRRFPLLSNYQKFKQNVDLQVNDQDPKQSSIAEDKQEDGSTSGAFDDKDDEKQTLQSRPKLIYNPTINQQIRSRQILRDPNGIPVGRLYKGKKFDVANSSNARMTISNNKFTIFETPFSAQLEKERKASALSKKKRIDGAFLTAKTYDNEKVVDWTKNHAERTAEWALKRGASKSSLNFCGDKYMQDLNTYWV